jgi:hypothetical protein
MSHIWHLLAADLVRHRALIGLWLLTVTGYAVMAGVTPIAAASEKAATTAGYLNLALSLGYVGIFVGLVPIVIQTHPLVGSDGFWMTRPIPPLALFVEKALLLGTLFVVVPVASDVALMAAHSVPAATIIAVAGQGVLFKALWTTLLVAIASVTASVPRFALVGGSLLVAIAAVMAAILAVDLARLEDNVPATGIEGSGDATSSVALVVLLIAAGVGAVLVQFLTRSRRRSVAVAGLAIVVAFVVSDHWPWPLLAWSPAIPAWTQRADALRLSSNPALARISHYSGMRSARAWRLVLSPVHVEGVEPGWDAQVSPLEATWSTDSHVLWKSPGPIARQPARIDHLDEGGAAVAIRAALGVTQLIEAHQEAGAATLVVLDDETFAKLPEVSGTYVARVDVWLTRYEVEAVLPLAGGATYQHGAYRLAINDVRRRPTGLSVLARISDAGSIFSREAAREHLYYLRNRATSEGVPVYAQSADISALRLLPFREMTFGAGSAMPSPWGFGTGSFWLTADAYSRPDAPQWHVSEDWLNHAELVVVSRRQEGSIERTLTVADFPIRHAPEQQSP